MISRDNYILIPAWAITDLNLKGTELLVFSVIYGFSQDGESCFEGSRQYLAEFTNSTTRTIGECLKSLCDKNYIIKNEINKNGVKFCTYASNFPTREKISLGVGNNFLGGREKISPNNIDIYTNKNIDKEKLNKKKNFEPPTVEDVRAYCIERNNGIDAEQFVDFYTANGWKVGKNPMKDWKACIRTWERNRNGQSKPTTNAQKNDVRNKVSSVYEQYIKPNL